MKGLTKMSTRLSQKEREGFSNIIKEDLKSIGNAVRTQIMKAWDAARKDILEKNGYNKKIERMKEIDEEMRKLAEEKHQLNCDIANKRLTVDQALEFGGYLNCYGEAVNANFYGIPVRCQTDYEIVQMIKKHVDFDTPSKFLYDLGRSSLRELIMCGSFEDAKAIYEKFYSFNFRKYGVDIPPRLTELKDGSALLEAPNGIKLIEGKTVDNKEK